MFLRYLVIVIVIYAFYYHKYHYRQGEPEVFREKRIKELEFLTLDYLKEKHGKKQIIVTGNSSVNPDVGEEARLRRMSLERFVSECMNGTDWYFKTEDSYAFLEELGLKPELERIFSREFPKEGVIHSSFSFWCGGKGTFTAWHTDMEDMSVLYVIQGKKRVVLAPPIYDNDMYKREKYYLGSFWSEVDFLNPDLTKFPKYKNVKTREIIVNSGEAIQIPRHWWHAVENLEPTIAITYCAYTHNYPLFAFPPEILRYIYYCWLKGSVILPPKVDSPKIKMTK